MHLIIYCDAGSMIFAALIVACVTLVLIRQKGGEP